VDLPETFAYLLGLRVRTRRVHEDRGRRYLVYRGALPDGREAAVLWRDLAGWTEDDYQRDRDFVAREKLAEGAALIFVNGQAAIPGATALDTLFKDRMFEGHSQRGRP
jgi:adenine-specific DNA-methyltransferase